MAKHAKDIVRGVHYIRILPTCEFVAVADAPVGTLGEHVTGIGPFEWEGGPIVIVREVPATSPQAPGAKDE